MLTSCVNKCGLSYYVWSQLLCMVRYEGSPQMCRVAGGPVFCTRRARARASMRCLTCTRGVDVVAHAWLLTLLPLLWCTPFMMPCEQIVTFPSSLSAQKRRKPWRVLRTVCTCLPTLGGSAPLSKWRGQRARDATCRPARRLHTHPPRRSSSTSAASSSLPSRMPND